ncbi:MAG TPA: hypothetical protein VF661_06835, partial [Actinomycetales bacterium]
MSTPSGSVASHLPEGSPPDASRAATARPTALAAVVGLLAAAVTIGVAELGATLLELSGRAGGTPSPVVAVGEAFIDRTPPWLKDFAVAAFGTNDKLVLLLGIGVVLALAAAGAGVLAARRRVPGL